MVLEIPKDHSTLEQMDEVIYQEALDETGTVPIDSLIEFDKDSITSRGGMVECKEEGTVEIAEELLRVHVIAPGKKPEGVTRIIYKNKRKRKNREIKRGD